MSKSTTSAPAAAVQQLEAGLQVLRLQLVRTRQRLYALEAAPRLEAAGRTPLLPMEFRSQFGEDLALWDLFGGQLDGFFIEVGAFDGVTYSVTYSLEAVGWKGLLIEAIPARCEECRRRRPGSRVVHAALGPRGSSGTAEFHVVSDQYGGMLSYLRPTADHPPAADVYKGLRSSVKVPLTTMDDLLKDHNGTIDAAVIDVEGNEVFVLQGFDLLRHRPRVLMLEDNTGGRNPVIASYMQALPYVFAGWVEVNRVYIRADETALIDRARSALFTFV